MSCKSFNCKRCGKCCGFVPFSPLEFEAIKGIAREKNIDFTFVDKIGYVPSKLVDSFLSIDIGKDDLSKINKKLDTLVCPFLEFDVLGKSNCSIYENRPFVCRLFGTQGNSNKNLKCPNNKYGDNDE